MEPKSERSLSPQQQETLRAIAASVRAQVGTVDSRTRGGSSPPRAGTIALFTASDTTTAARAAQALANELGLEVYRVDLGQVVSKYIGETEKNLRRVFDAAERAGAVLFFDEADALFGKRTDVKDSHDRFANIGISYLLERLEAFQGLAILATNLRKESIDEAFIRRIRHIVSFVDR